MTFEQIKKSRTQRKKLGALGAAVTGGLLIINEIHEWLKDLPEAQLQEPNEPRDLEFTQPENNP